jgi:DNA-binding NtrC family response regulator
MTRDEPPQEPQTVALVCGEPRLRRILRLALEAGGYNVRECPRLRDLPASGTVAAAVVDLDSLRPRPVALDPYLHIAGLPETLPALLISVYPPEAVERPRPGPTDYLQPPFPADEIAARVERLIRAAARLGGAERPGGRLSSAR